MTAMTQHISAGGLMSGVLEQPVKWVDSKNARGILVLWQSIAQKYSKIGESMPTTLGVELGLRTSMAMVIRMVIS